MGDLPRRELHEVLLDADAFEDLPGKWQAAIVEAEQTRPKLRLISGDLSAGRGRGQGSARSSSTARRPEYGDASAAANRLFWAVRDR